MAKRSLKEYVGAMEWWHWAVIIVAIVISGEILKSHHWASPSICSLLMFKGTALIGLLCLIQMLKSIPLVQHIQPLWLLLFLGTMLNIVVMVANGGYMPAATLDTSTFGCYPIYGCYIPTDGANLIWLSDWIFGIISPGDIIIWLAIILAIGVILYRVWRRRSQKRNASIYRYYGSEDYSTAKVEGNTTTGEMMIHDLLPLAIAMMVAAGLFANLEVSKEKGNGQ